MEGKVQGGRNSKSEETLRTPRSKQIDSGSADVQVSNCCLSERKTGTMSLHLSEDESDMFLHVYKPEESDTTTLPNPAESGNLLLTKPCFHDNFSESSHEKCVGSQPVPSHCARWALNFPASDDMPPRLQPHAPRLSASLPSVKTMSPSRSALNEPQEWVPARSGSLARETRVFPLAKSLGEAGKYFHSNSRSRLDRDGKLVSSLRSLVSQERTFCFDTSKESPSYNWKKRLTLTQVTTLHHNPTMSTPTPVVTVVPTTAMAQDGRHALNYEPRDAFDDLATQESPAGEDKETNVTEILHSERPDDGEPTIRRRRKKMRWMKKADKKSGRHKMGKKQALDAREDLTDAGPDQRVPRALTCPVCLDIFYNPHVVRPCGHSFCEPCLRRLAKYSQDADRSATCPVCRQPINFCVKDSDLTTHIQVFFPDGYYRRRHSEGSNRYMRHPLPASPPSAVSAKHIARIIASRTRLLPRRPRVGSMPIRINFWRFMSLAVGLVLFKCLLLVILLCMYCLLYDHSIHITLLQWSVTGIMTIVALLTPKTWGLAGMTVMVGVLTVIIKHTWGSGHSWPRPRLTFKHRHRPGSR